MFIKNGLTQERRNNMEAPDKIYMPNELLSEEWQRHIEGEDTAYIRKDALLEWARGEMMPGNSAEGKGWN